MRVLVVGGTEFISFHTLTALRREGHEVIVLNRGRHADRLPTGVRTIVCDRTDHPALAARDVCRARRTRRQPVSRQA